MGGGKPKVGFGIYSFSEIVERERLLGVADDDNHSRSFRIAFLTFCQAKRRFSATHFL